MTYYRVFFGLGACMSSRTGGHLFRTGAKRDLLTAHSGLDAHFRAQRNLARALADAEALTAAELTVVRNFGRGPCRAAAPGDG